MLTKDVATPSEASRGPEQGQVGPPGMSAAPLVAAVVAHEGGGSPNLTASPCSVVVETTKGSMILPSHSLPKKVGS